MEGAIPDDADPYDAWVAALRARNGAGTSLALGLRGASRYCAPGCARSRARWALPPRVFASADMRGRLATCPARCVADGSNTGLLWYASVQA